ncbi:MAG TPA: cytochrome c oxidase assembly protein [Burkholderiales bacterium]|jgi:cytochrome c oxidase assembly protein subunit 11|nr:cytochrome c oxidase assembly protein [Burkholderiales bacterium]
MSAPERNVAAANRVLLAKLAVVAALMFGFGFALVPFYEKICQVTGIRNLLQPDEVVPANTQVDSTRTVTIEFDANTQRLAWTFRPLEGHRTVHPGEVTEVVYEIRNTLDRPVTGQAIPSYGPQRAAQYLKKLECFCFQSQTLAPGEVRRMPVVFVLDPALPADVNTVTLSYTFFEVAGRDGKPG